jgi:hypothetical protein
MITETAKHSVFTAQSKNGEKYDRLSEKTEAPSQSMIALSPKMRRGGHYHQRRLDSQRRR